MELKVTAEEGEKRMVRGGIQPSCNTAESLDYAGWFEAS